MPEPLRYNPLDAISTVLGKKRQELPTRGTRQSEDPDNPLDEISTVIGGGNGMPSGSFTNVGVAEGLGFPVDVANMALSTVGLGSDKPFLGSARTQEALHSLGLAPPPGTLPSNFRERAERAIGATVASAPLFGAAGIARASGAAARTSGTVTQASIDAIRSGKPTPEILRDVGSAISSEAKDIFSHVARSGRDVAAAISSAFGEEVAVQMNGDTPAGRFIGSLLGGLSPVAAASAVRSLPSAVVIRSFRKLAVPFTQSAAIPRASRRVKELSENPQAAAARMGRETLEGTQLTPAQKSGEPGLLALEMSIIDSNQSLRGPYRERIAQSNKAAIDVIKSAGDNVDIERTKEFFSLRNDYLNGLVNLRIQNAVQLAKQKLGNITTRFSSRDSQKIVRSEIESAYRAARVTESEVWNGANLSELAEPQETRTLLRTQLSQRSVASDPDEIPVFVRKLLGDLDKKGKFKLGVLQENTSVNDLKTLRGRILSEEAAERAKPGANQNKLRLLNEIQESLLVDMQATSSGDDLKSAIDFSRELNNTFRRGTVGKLVGFDRAGGRSIAPELTLRRTIGRGGEEAGVMLSDIEKALVRGQGKEGKEAIRDFLTNEFKKTSFVNGEFSVSAANRFIKKHEAALARDSDLKKMITDATETFSSSITTREIGAARLKRIADPRVNMANVILNAKVGDEIAAVMKNKNPPAAMATIMRQASRDKSGDATNGIKSAYGDFLIQRAKTRAKDALGQDITSGKALRLARDENIGVFNAVYSSPGEKRRFDLAVEALEATEGTTKSNRLKNIMEDTPGMVLNLITRVMAAKTGAKVGGKIAGAPLVLAGAFSKEAQKKATFLTRDKAEKLLIDAIGDEELFKALLLDTAIPVNAEKVTVRLNAWLAATGTIATEEFNAQESAE